MESVLSPIYLKRTPRYDCFGSPYLIKSSTTQYFIVSVGPDGRPQEDYESITINHVRELQNTHSESADDLIYAAGTFVSFPENLVSR